MPFISLFVSSLKGPIPISFWPFYCTQRRTVEQCAFTPIFFSVLVTTLSGFVSHAVDCSYVLRAGSLRHPVPLTGKVEYLPKTKGVTGNSFGTRASAFILSLYNALFRSGSIAAQY